MSDTAVRAWQDASLEAQAIPCPTCGAANDDRCKTATGATKYEHHGTRRAAYRAAFFGKDA